MNSKIQESTDNLNLHENHIYIYAMYFCSRTLQIKTGISFEGPNYLFLWCLCV